MSSANTQEALQTAEVNSVNFSLVINEPLWLVRRFSLCVATAATCQAVESEFCINQTSCLYSEKTCEPVRTQARKDCSGSTSQEIPRKFVWFCSLLVGFRIYTAWYRLCDLISYAN